MKDDDQSQILCSLAIIVAAIQPILRYILWLFVFFWHGRTKNASVKMQIKIREKKAGK